MSAHLTYLSQFVHDWIIEDVFVENITSASKVKNSIGLFGSWIQVFEVDAHSLFNFICEVMFAQPLIYLVNWPWTIFVKASKFFLNKIWFNGYLLTDSVLVVSAETFGLGC